MNATAKTLMLRLAGQPMIEGPSGALQLAPRDALLLAWLAVEGPTTRDRMCTLLWPDSDAEQARTTLRQRLFQLKKALGSDVAVGTPMLRLADAVAHDLADATELLGDLQGADGAEMHAWLQGQRESRLQRSRDALVAHVEALESGGDLAAALSTARSLLRLDPMSEVAHQRVIRAHYMLGDRAAALNAFDACEAMLRDELGARPSEATMALLTLAQKGSTPAVAALRRSPPEAILRPPRMIGRDAELQALQQAWDSRQVVAVVGEAGMGKSRLLAEFIANQSGVVRVAGRPADAGVPFATLARLLREVHELHPRAALEAGERQQLARVLPELGSAGTGFPEGQRLQLQHATATFLQAAPGLAGLVLDDLHFADAASLEMLQALVGDTPPSDVRWALAWRPADTTSPVNTLQAALLETVQLQLVELQPLSEAALADLVEVLGLGIEGRAVAAPLRRRTGGNPLFVLETLKQAWAEQGLQRLARGEPLPRPLSVDKLIDRRVGQLSPPALALARVAAIAGVDFSVALAESVLGVRALQFADAMLELEDAQVLKGTQFAHDLVFDAVVRSVPAVIAQHLHSSVASWLEQHAGEPARVAQHWLAAQQPAQALPWLTLAAERARLALRDAELLAFLDQRADIEQALGDRGAAFETRREALHVQSDADRDVADLEARLDVLQALADSEPQRIRAWLERASIACRRTESQPAEGFARRALEAARRQGDSALVRESQLVLFDILTLADCAAEALALGESCLGWIDAVDEVWRMNFHGAMAVLYSNLGQLAPCRAQTELARQIAQRRGDVANDAVAVGNLAIAVAEAGRLTEGVSLNLQALRMSAGLQQSQAGDDVGYLNLIEPCTLMGQYDKALRWSDEAERGLTGSAPAGVPLARIHRALCFWHLGQRARAIQLMGRVAAEPDLILPARARLCLLACRVARDKGEATAGHVDSALAFFGTGTRRHLRELVLIEQALSLPASQALAALDDIAQRGMRLGYLGHTLEARLRGAQMATATDPALAGAHALAALQLAETVDTVASYRGELWLLCARALVAAGEGSRAMEAADAGVAWVRRVAQSHVPGEFRESFMHRSPVNVALLSLRDDLHRHRP